jgi:putative phage-type endonuclease
VNDTKSEIDIEQGTDEWRLARLGSVGASRIPDVLAKTTVGRPNYMSELLCETISGKPTESYVSAAMQAGTETEPEARAAYWLKSGNKVRRVGLIRHPTIEKSHCSPDGFVADDGMIEIKCPQRTAHLNTLLEQRVPKKYMPQVCWQLACCPDRRWVDYVSYNRDFSENTKLFVCRVERSPEVVSTISHLENEVAAFLRERADKMAKLNSLYEAP